MASRSPVHDDRAFADAAFGGLVPIVVAAALVPLRGHVAAVNVALLLTLVVVTMGALGGRAAGALGAVTAAMSFDFFFTRPYLSFVIHDADDVEMTALLLALGLLSGWLASQLRWTRHRLAGGRSELDRIRHLAGEVARGSDPADVILTAQTELSDLLGLAGCTFDAAPFTGRLDLPRLDRDGVVTHMHYRLEPDGKLALERPPAGMALPVLTRGQIV